MIYVKKPVVVPPKLIEFQTVMNDCIGTYGNYTSIPEEELKSFNKGYRHEDVRSILFNCNHHKCAYCEVIPIGSRLRVDHFFPKKLYPEHTLDWDNFLPCCDNCNTKKSSHDTKNDPIINPSRIDPFPYYDFDYLWMLPAVDSPDPVLTKRTIDVCDLNRRELLRSRANLLVDLTIYQKDINIVLIDLEEPMSALKIKNRIIRLEESLEIIEEMARDTEKFSAFIKKFLEKSIYIREVKGQIKNIKIIYKDIFN